MFVSSKAAWTSMTTYFTSGKPVNLMRLECGVRLYQFVFTLSLRKRGWQRHQNTQIKNRESYRDDLPLKCKSSLVLLSDVSQGKQ